MCYQPTKNPSFRTLCFLRESFDRAESMIVRTFIKCDCSAIVKIRLNIKRCFYKQNSIKIETVHAYITNNYLFEL